MLEHVLVADQPEERHGCVGPEPVCVVHQLLHVEAHASTSKDSRATEPLLPPRRKTGGTTTTHRAHAGRRAQFIRASSRPRHGRVTPARSTWGPSIAR